MKAISLWQPWASAVAVGSKQIETRSWKTTYRGPLAIHAAKKWNRKLDAYARYLSSDLSSNKISLAGDDDGCNKVDVGCKKLQRWLPLGAFVCVVDLVDCVEMTKVWIDQQSSVERLLGDYEPGRWGWMLENLQIIRPVPAKGNQGLWTVDLDAAGKDFYEM